MCCTGTLLRFTDKTKKWETFKGENLHEFCGFVAIRETFLWEIWGRCILGHSKSEQSVKVFSAKIVFFTNLQKNFPQMFPTLQ